MRVFLALAFTILFSFGGHGFSIYNEVDCTAIEAIVITEKPNAGKENGEIIIQAKGGLGKLHYFFFNERGYPINSTKEEQNSIKNLGKGIYKCSVVDENGCIKQLTIELN